MENDIEEIDKQERTERFFRKAEMEVIKAENLIKYKNEIYNKPKRTWF